MKHRCFLYFAMIGTMSAFGCENAAQTNENDSSSLGSEENQDEITNDTQEDTDSMTKTSDDEQTDESDTDQPFGEECEVTNLSLSPGEDGWVDGCSNVKRFQGYWYVYSNVADKDLYEIELSINEDEEVCASGHIDPSADGADLSGIEVGMGLWLCQTRSDNAAEQTYTMGSCPWGLSPYSILGFAAEIQGRSNSDLKVVYGKPNMPSFASFPADFGTSAFGYPDATVSSDPDLNILQWGWDEVNTIRFEVTGENLKGDGSFEICVSEVTPVEGHVDFL